MKKYVRAPLPFNGQKARWLNTFRAIIEETDFETYVDAFGGSGLLAHNIKALKPRARVVYNDFDGYTERLRNIDRTNALLSDLRDMLQGIPQETRIGAELKEKILDRIKSEAGYVDFATVSSALLFTMHHADGIEELSKMALYNNIPINPYSADGYLEGVTTVSADYGELFGQYKGGDALFILDPPYLNTDNTRYKNAKYWRIGDYLRVVKAMKDVDYIYFTSGKSQIEELFSFLQEEFQTVTPFSGAQRRSVNTGKGGTVDYTEHVYYRIRDEKTNSLFGLSCG